MPSHGLVESRAEETSAVVASTAANRPHGSEP